MTIQNLPRPHHRRNKKHARIHLPHMNADDALLVVALLEKAVEAIWRAHGDAMADRLAAAGIETPRPEDARWDDDQAAEDCGL